MRLLFFLAGMCLLAWVGTLWLSGVRPQNAGAAKPTDQGGRLSAVAEQVRQLLPTGPVTEAAAPPSQEPAAALPEGTLSPAAEAPAATLAPPLPADSAEVEEEVLPPAPTEPRWAAQAQVEAEVAAEPVSPWEWQSRASGERAQQALTDIDRLLGR